MQYTSHGSWAKYETWNQVDVDLILSLMMVTILSTYTYTCIQFNACHLKAELSYFPMTKQNIIQWRYFSQPVSQPLILNQVSVYLEKVCVRQSPVSQAAQAESPPSRFPVSGVESGQCQCGHNQPVSCRECLWPVTVIMCVWCIRESGLIYIFLCEVGAE